MSAQDLPTPLFWERYLGLQWWYIWASKCMNSCWLINYKNCIYVESRRWLSPPSITLGVQSCWKRKGLAEDPVPDASKRTGSIVSREGEYKCTNKYADWPTGKGSQMASKDSSPLQNTATYGESTCWRSGRGTSDENGIRGKTDKRTIHPFSARKGEAMVRKAKRRLISCSKPSGTQWVTFVSAPKRRGNKTIAPKRTNWEGKWSAQTAVKASR